MKSIEIVDDFLPQEEFNSIQKLMMGENFPWFYVPEITFHPKFKKNMSNYYIAHMFYTPGMPKDYFKIWTRTFLKKINCRALRRIKGNLYNSTPKVIAHQDHIDYNDIPTKTCLFYINTNNGPTVINKMEVKAIANRAVFFAGNVPHHSSTCTDQLVRISVVFNYF